LKNPSQYWVLWPGEVEFLTLSVLGGLQLSPEKKIHNAAQKEGHQEGFLEEEDS
jgi:hypothetical protein